MTQSSNVGQEIATDVIRRYEKRALRQIRQNSNPSVRTGEGSQHKSGPQRHGRCKGCVLASTGSGCQMRFRAAIGPSLDR